MKAKCGNCGHVFYETNPDLPVLTVSAAHCHVCDWLGLMVFEDDE